MATFTVADDEIGAYNKTLTADAADTVTLEGRVEAIEVVNLNGSAAIYFTTDGSEPEVEGAATHEIPAASGVRVVNIGGKDNVEVKLISDGTPVYSVARVG